MSNNNALTPEDVARYLRANPDFFQKDESLLSELTLPHPSGEAVSLVERQIQVLRDRNNHMLKRHHLLLDNARENDRLFDKSKRLVLSLLEARDLDDLIDALYFSFSKEFKIEFYRLILFGNPQSIQTSAARVENIHKAKDILGKRLSASRAVIGGVNLKERDFLFDNDADRIGSAAFSVLSHGKTFGILAIGNHDENYYQSSMGTLFLSYITEILNRLLPRFI